MKNTIILSCLLVAAACQPSNHNGAKSVSSGAVINGERVDPEKEKDLFHSAVALFTMNSLCSGVLVSENVVMTAAHCVSSEAGDLKSIYMGDKASVYYSFFTDDRKYEVKNIIPHPEYAGSDNDIALIFLKEKVKEPFKPISIFTETDQLKSGYPIRVAGFSLYSKAQRQSFLEFFEKPITNDYEASNLSEDLMVNLLTRNSVQLTDIKPEDDFIDMFQGMGGMCQGDSGGPTMIERGGELLLVGINRSVVGNSTDKADCEGMSRSTLVNFHKDWIKKTITENEGTQPTFTTGQGSLNEDEYMCAQVINRMANYTLVGINEEYCKFLKEEVDFKQTMEKLSEFCEKSCGDQKNFKGACEYMSKENEKLFEKHEEICRGPIEVKPDNEIR